MIAFCITLLNVKSSTPPKTKEDTSIKGLGTSTRKKINNSEQARCSVLLILSSFGIFLKHDKNNVAYLLYHKYVIYYDTIKHLFSHQLDYITLWIAPLTIGLVSSLLQLLVLLLRFFLLSDFAPLTIRFVAALLQQLVLLLRSFDNRFCC